MNIFQRKPQPEPEIRYVEVPTPHNELYDWLFWGIGLLTGYFLCLIIIRLRTKE